MAKAPRTQENKKPTYFMKKKSSRPCYYCENKLPLVEFKNTDTLKRFLNERAKILPRKQSGLCAKHQRQVAAAVKLARNIGLIPYTIK